MTRDPALDLLDPLVGDWETQGSHPLMNERIAGSASIQWLEGRTVLIWRATQVPTTVPPFIAIIGGGETPGTWPMHYFDMRGVFRVYQLRMDGGVLRQWRDHPGFDQRGTGTFKDGGRVLELRYELNQDGTWRPDLEMTYRRR